MIPKVILQTAKKPLPQYVIDMFLGRCPNFQYKFFDDNAILQYFRENPLSEFPNIEAVFHSFSDGAHKSDLFRYYFLYVEGGFYVDSDAMVYIDLTEDTEAYQYISVNSSVFPNTIFQGILAAEPKNQIIYKALQNVYNVDTNRLNYDYYYFIKDMYKILHLPEIIELDYKIKLYAEMDYGDRALVLEGNRINFIHFWKSKVIPLNPME
uniref:Glycosyltransferase n=1 Tax=viral metagenome TaxID=1070528 RepID=A0A6C0DRG0_9ZZZZ